MNSTLVQLPNLLVTSYQNQLEELCEAFARVPDQLCPPSPISMETSEEHIEKLRERISNAVIGARHDVFSPEWTNVASSVKMPCTTRRYKGIAAGTRFGDDKEVDAGDYKFVLPDTAEEWEECEKRWKSRATAGPSKASKSRAKQSNPIPKLPAQALSPERAQEVREKVQKWQAKVVNVVEDPDLGQEDVDNLSGRKKGKQPIKQKHLPSRKVNPTAKTRAAKAPKPSNSALPPGNPVARVEPHDRTGPTAIADITESDFLPPSFPSQLDTSTPPPHSRVKPAPIPVRPSLQLIASSPSSSPRLPNSSAPRVGTLQATADPPTNLPTIDTPRQTGKRLRSSTPPEDHASSLTHGPPNKRPRTEAYVEPTPHKAMHPSTPSPTTPRSKSRSPPPTKSTAKGLGNAKGLPVTSTPNRDKLPTLTELLASSRRSRPRPRPPPRKSRSQATTPSRQANERNQNEPGDELPALPIVPVHRAVSPAPTTTRTHFSSPLSGSSSSGSPQSTRHLPAEPISPLFNTSTFAPPITSTQNQPARGGDAGFFGTMGLSQPAGVIPPFARGGSGYVGMGYSSQFDVEGNVGIVGDLLERDVDFNGWLKDVLDVEVEGETSLQVE